MKNISIFSVMAMVAITFSSCKKLETPYNELTDSKEGAQISIAKSTGNEQVLNIFLAKDDVRTLKFGASFGALGLPANNINIKFAIDQKALDSINDVRTKQGLSTYILFPADYYNITGLNATIPAGKTSSDLITINYFPKKFDITLHSYLLPISITNADGYKIASNKTIFLTINGLQELLVSKKGWTITTDSQETASWDPGYATRAIDDDLGTWWHTEYDKVQPLFPHYIEIDMKTSIYVTKIALYPRDGYKNSFTVFDLEGSTDGKTWVNLGKDLTLDPNDIRFQEYPVKNDYYRYIKITATVGAYAGYEFASLAEVNVYQYK